MEEALPLLIVEHHQDRRTLLQHFFARQQITVQTVSSVAVAIAYLAQRPVQVVLTDLFLPDEVGIALVRHVRTTAPHTRVIVMGAFSAPVTQQKAIAAGAYMFLEKPFPLARLGAEVQHALQDNRGQRRGKALQAMHGKPCSSDDHRRRVRVSHLSSSDNRSSSWV